MKIHEYQGRDLLASAGVPVPAGRMVESVEQATAAAKELFHDGAAIVVVKAQVHAGGRGKAGFVKVVKTPEAVTEAARFMLSNRMVSPQTGPEGLEVKRLLVAAGVDIEKEFYLAITVDRANNTSTMIASAEGGVEIEAVAEKNPDAILKAPLHPLAGLQAWQARDLAFDLGFKGKQVGQAVRIMLALARLFQDSDASLAEINPLVVTPATAEHPDGQVLAIDAKFNFDDNGLFRQKAIAALFDPAEEDPAELRAEKFGLSYVALDGNIGCLVNGAGLAMSTMDIIKLHGGEPANFLDVGGSASEEAVREAFDIILSDPKVAGVLVNIFGGIMQCDKIARGVVGAAKTAGFRVPLVVRLEGTNVEQARVILEEAQSELPTMEAATDLADAARRCLRGRGLMMLVLFDIDGTLLRSQRAGRDAMCEAASEMFGTDCSLEGVEVAGRLDPLIWIDIGRKYGLAEPMAEHDRFRRIYGRILEDRLERHSTIIALPGVLELLAALQACSDVTLGLVTGNYPETGRLKIRHAGIITDQFTANAWGCDGATRRDLPPRAIGHYVSAKGSAIAAAEVVVIGDTPHDVDCARHNGCRSIAVATGGFEIETLRATGADLVAGDLTDTAMLVDWLRSPAGSI